MLLMIDNYDSFTYNVVQYLGELGAEVKVIRNDEMTIAQIEALSPERIVVSPGPCTPSEAGVSIEAILHFAGKLPILGVCLGHQSIGQAFGGDVVRARQVMHGKTSPVHHRDLGRGFAAVCRWRGQSWGFLMMQVGLLFHDRHSKDARLSQIRGYFAVCTGLFAGSHTHCNV